MFNRYRISCPFNLFPTGLKQGKCASWREKDLAGESVEKAETVKNNTTVLDLLRFCGEIKCS